MGTEIPLVWRCPECKKEMQASKIGAKAEKKQSKKKYCSQCRKHVVKTTKVPKGKK